MTLTSSLFGHRWDEEIPLDSDKLERLYTKTTPWRNKLAVDDKVEMRFDNVSNRGWS